MTPAIIVATNAKIAFRLKQYEHDTTAPAYGLEAVEKLSLDPARVFKTLIFEMPQAGFAVAALPVTHELDLKACARILGAKKAWMAKPAEAERISGYSIGGISPLGHKRQLSLLIDASAQSFDSIFVSAGRRGLEIELAAHDLARLTAARFTDLKKPHHGV